MNFDITEVLQYDVLYRWREHNDLRVCLQNQHVPMFVCLLTLSANLFERNKVLFEIRTNYFIHEF